VITAYPTKLFTCVNVSVFSHVDVIVLVNYKIIQTIESQTTVENSEVQLQKICSLI
jgi:hypothetical protein